jgi:hypothetical protein
MSRSSLLSFGHITDMSRRGAIRILERSKQTVPYSKHGDGASLMRMVEQFHSVHSVLALALDR